MTSVLLTGFEAFSTLALNPTTALVEDAANLLRNDTKVVSAVLPVSYEQSTQRLLTLLDQHRPDLVIATGVALGRTALTPERVAINCASSTIPDNDGTQPTDSALEPDGPAAYFTKLPIRAIVAACVDAGYPAEISDSAGTYVCNAVFYRLMGALPPQVQGGFVHVPLPPDGGYTPDRLAEALAITVRTVLAQM